MVRPAAHLKFSPSAGQALSTPGLAKPIRQVEAGSADPGGNSRNSRYAGTTSAILSPKNRPITGQLWYRRPVAGAAHRIADLDPGPKTGQHLARHHAANKRVFSTGYPSTPEGSFGLITPIWNLTRDPRPREKHGGVLARCNIARKGLQAFGRKNTVSPASSEATRRTAVSHMDTAAGRTSGAS